MTNQPRTVIYLSPTGPEVKEIAEVDRSTGSQCLVKVEYSGVDPADIKHSTIGLRSSVVGYDFAGEVVEVGPTSPFKPGDKIFSQNDAAPGQPLYIEAHQDLAMENGPAFYLAPTDRIKMQEAAVLPAMTSTRADSLFNVLELGFSAAGITGAEKQAVLIWGASSAVSVASLQLAAAAGRGPIGATASSTHHAKLRDLGVDFCFDYKDPEVVEKIQESVRNSGWKIGAVLDAVGAGSMTTGGDFQKSNSAKAARCADQVNRKDINCKFAWVIPTIGDKRWKMASTGRTTDPRSPFQRDDLESWQQLQQNVMTWVTQIYGPKNYIAPNIKTFEGLQAGLMSNCWIPYVHFGI